MYYKKDKVNNVDGINDKIHVLNTSFGGRGEHSILDVYMTVKENELLFSLIEKSYNDWGGASVLDGEVQKEKSFEYNGESITSEFVYDTIIDWIRNECGMIYYRRIAEDIRVEKCR